MEETIMRFEKKVAVVTGGTRGIGYQITSKLASEGANVITLSKSGYIDSECNLANCVGTSEQSLISSLKVDISQKKEVDLAFKQIYERFGRIDILVNNAGIWEAGMIKDVTEKQWDRMMAINLKSVLFCSQAVYNIMINQKYGKIINISSISARVVGTIHQVHYRVSKAGIIMLTRCLAQELAEHQINVNAIAPSMTHTSMANQHTKEQLEEVTKKIPLGRIAVPEDIANTVAFLASEEAAFITGEVINVNGGQLMN
jgi:3-oxoacyl-[acyl-carrier protein] reductase